MPSDYREAEQERIFEIRTDVEARINSALSESEVASALADAKALLDQLKTDEEYRAEEEERKKEEEIERRAEEEAAAIKKARAARTTIRGRALKKRRARIKWKKVRGVTGYKVYRAVRKSGKYRLIRNVKKVSVLKYTDRRLKKGKKYFYKVRTYTRIDGRNYLGKWSKVKKIYL